MEAVRSATGSQWIARQATDLPRSVAFDHSRLTSSPVSYGILNTFCCVKLRCVTVFDGVHPFYYVCHVLLRLSRRVKFIDIKWHIMGTLVPSYWSSHYSEQHRPYAALCNWRRITIPNFLNQLCSRLLRSAVVIILKDLFVYKRKNCALYCMVSTFCP